MRIIDITGPIHNDMWTYGPPYPEVRIAEIQTPDWIPYPTYSWQFILGGQTGTYLETGLHMKRGRPGIIDIPVESLVMRDAVVLKVEGKEHKDDAVALEDLKRCAADIREGDAVFVCVGRDKKWRDADYVTDSPYMTREAMDWIMDHNPFLFGGDWARFESWENPQLFFQRFFDEEILLLAPVVNLTQVSRPRVKLTVLPMKIEKSAAAPARAILIEEE